MNLNKKQELSKPLKNIVDVLFKNKKPSKRKFTGLVINEWEEDGEHYKSYNFNGCVMGEGAWIEFKKQFKEQFKNKQYEQ